MSRHKKISKKHFYALSIIIFTLGVSLTGISLAYFRSQDKVTNRHPSSDTSILLLETKWDTNGFNKASVMQPGIVIEKNPEVYNKSEYPVFVRMKITFTDDTDTEITGERLQSLTDHIYISDTTKLFDESGHCQNPDFTYADGWFYYKKDDIFTKLPAGQSTSSLFEKIKVPVLKSEYTGFFDTPFCINVTAQAISAFTDDENVVSSFDNSLV